jgi:NDP-sugar pyrophosphorylase family protein
MKLAAIEQLMLKHSLQQVPVIDERGVIVSLALYGTLLPRERLENEVFLMVGGLGSRLGDLTRHIPKPLLRLGDKPILEIIIDSLLSQGFNRFTFAVNYKAELIERHFGNGSRWGAEIRYLRESKRLGTCGALGLVEELPTRPFVVMNGDILTKVQFRHMLDFHTDHAAAATMAVREFSFQVPFGVTRVEGDKVREISEKPVERYLVNAGIYVLSPAALPLIPSGDYFDMTTLLTRLLDARMPVHSYVVDDYWLDIGRIDDLQKAHADFETNWLQQDAPR